MDYSTCTYDEEKKIWKGATKPKLCNENISAGEFALSSLRTKNPQEIMQICDSENTTMTFGVALSTSIKIAQYFKKIGLTADDVVGIFAPESTYVMPIALAAWFNANPFQAINCKLEKSVLENLYEFSRPKIIFCDGLQYEKVKAASTNIKPLIFTVCNHIENEAKIEDILQSTIVADEALFQAQPLKYGSNQTMVILVSSGTSGSPKGVCVPNSMCITDFSFTRASTKMFSTSSIDWSSGLLTFMANVLVGGTRIITTQPFTPKYLLELIIKYKVNFLATNCALLLETSRLEAYNKETMHFIEFVFIVGSYCSEISLKNMQSVLTQGLLFYGYGLTETGGVSGRFDATKPNSVGRLLSNVQIKIVDANNGERLGCREIGEICINQEKEWGGYYNNPIATSDILDNEGFIHTGDLGYMDEDNYLYLVGRCKDIMKYLGFQYSPIEIEQTIAELSDVVDVCVFGVFDDTKLDVPAAAVVKREGSTLTAEDIIEYVKSKTTVPHKRIQYGVFFVQHMPRNQNGKILRHKVKEICLDMEKYEKKA